MIRATRGFRYWVIRLIVPPLPAASRPSKRMTTRCPVARIHSCTLAELGLQSVELALVDLLVELGRVSSRSAWSPTRLRGLAHDPSGVAHSGAGVGGARVVEPVPVEGFLHESRA